MIPVLILFLVVLALAIRLVWVVAGDGYGTTPSPRSHSAELGTWVDRELRR